MRISDWSADVCSSDLTAHETWINNYTEGTEAHTKVGTGSGKAASRFIDNLVGSTTIEYESDLRNTAKLDPGSAQVQEQAAGLVSAGMLVSTARGVLADKVEWYASIGRASWRERVC